MWAQGGQCELAPDFMLSFCRKSCGCGSPVSDTTSTSSTSTSTISVSTTTTRPPSTTTQKTTTIPGYWPERFIFLHYSPNRLFFIVMTLIFFCCILQQCFHSRFQFYDICFSQSHATQFRIENNWLSICLSVKNSLHEFSYIMRNSESRLLLGAKMHAI